MNRRTSVKGILALSFIGISSLSVLKWFGLNKELSLDNILPYKNLIAELAETIIPRTETPGAKDANVENYIIQALLNCHSKLEQNNFKQSFSQCNSSQRESILAHFEKEETYSISVLNKIHNKLLGKPFIDLLKSLTVAGYCQSELGATQGLAYEFIPGNYLACIPLNQNQKSWATK